MQRQAPELHFFFFPSMKWTFDLFVPFRIGSRDAFSVSSSLPRKLMITISAQLPEDSLDLELNGEQSTVFTSQRQ
jgi:hypothetical protein